MTSIERFVLANGMTKHAWGPWGDNSSWGASTGKGLAARFVGGFVPVVDTALFGGDAINDFSHGRVGSGIVNTGLAGLGLIGMGGVGKAVVEGAKGVGMLGRIGKSMPMMSKVLGAGKSVLSPVVKAIGAPGRAIGENLMSRTGPGLGSTMREFSGSLLKPRTPGVMNTIRGTGNAIGQAGRSALSLPGRAMNTTGAMMRTVKANPWKTTAGVYGGSYLGGKLDEASALARQGNEENLTNMRNSLEQMHQNPVFNNPMYAGGGMNPNYADVNPVGYGAPERPSGMQMAGQLLGPALNSFLGS